MSGKIINPATGKPFAEARPSADIVRLRRDIIQQMRLRQQQHAKYDVAQDSSKNERHWQWADNLSPNAANSLAVRKKLRSRSRYEISNNGFLKGILLTKSVDMVGSGPSLQITDKRFTPEQRQQIEKQYARRSKLIRLRRKLRQLHMAKMGDGEGFSVQMDNTKLPIKVKVDQKVLECDQFSHYTLGMPKKHSQFLEVDGVKFYKRTGEPAYYHILNVHPGEDSFYSLEPLEGQWVKAEDVIHWFRRDRPWLRGIPETVPTLPLWALLRRYSLAVVQNAEIAADFTVLLKSLQPAKVSPFSMSNGEPSETDADDWFNSFPVDRGLMTVLPDKYDLEQLDPKQPVTAYDAFVNALVQEAARPLLVPRNMALGNSGDYNMASSALDRQLYVSGVNDERSDCEAEVLDKDLEQWWFEAIRIPTYFEDNISGAGVASVVNKFSELRVMLPDHCWRWDSIPEHTDPVKVASAIDILHKAGHLSDIDIQEGRFNRPIEEHYENLEQQQERREQIGILGAEAKMEVEIPLDDDDET